MSRTASAPMHLASRTSAGADGEILPQYRQRGGGPGRHQVVGRPPKELPVRQDRQGGRPARLVGGGDAAGSRSGASSPLLGLARFTSAMTATPSPAARARGEAANRAADRARAVQGIEIPVIAGRRGSGGRRGCGPGRSPWRGEPTGRVAGSGRQAASRLSTARVRRRGRGGGLAGEGGRGWHQVVVVGGVGRHGWSSSRWSWSAAARGRPAAAAPPAPRRRPPRSTGGRRRPGSPPRRAPCRGPGGQRVAVVDLPERAVGQGDAHARLPAGRGPRRPSRPSGW